MSWARLDDNFHDHPKVVGLTLPALGLWTVCLTWAHRNIQQCREPGHLPVGTVRRFAGPKASRLGAELVDAGMWESSEGGWLIHDFGDYLAPDRERSTPGTSPELSAKRRRAGSKGGKAAQQTKQRGRANEQLAGEQNGQVPVSPVVASNEATPEPVPDVLPKPTVSARNGLEPLPDTTGTILGEWLQRCQKRPPESVVKRIGKDVRGMLAEGIDPDDVRRGMASWQSKGLDPSVLPSVVNQVMNGTVPVRRTSGLGVHFEQ
jgi:hypothetical protein